MGIRFSLAFALLALAACTPQVEIDECADAPECLEPDGLAEKCNRECVEQRICCECLGDFDCVEGGPDRCVENLEAGALVSADVVCVADTARCGAFCKSLSFRSSDACCTCLASIDRETGATTSERFERGCTAAAADTCIAILESGGTIVTNASCAEDFCTSSCDPAGLEVQPD